MFHYLEKIDKDEIIFTIIGEHISLINAIRRTIKRDVKTYALDKIIIQKNTSNTINSQLAHRISLIPINTNEICDIKLDITNKSINPIYIKTGDIEILNGDMKFNKDIILVYLEPEKTINITATTSFGSGYKNARYQPASTVAFKICENIFLNKNLVEKISENYMKELI